MKAFALLAMILTMDASAQTCPAYPPNVDTQGKTQNLVFVGASGCTNASTPRDQNYQCANVNGDALTFHVVTAQGRPIQSCDTLKWTFGDGSTQTSTGDEVVTHQYKIASWQTFAFAASVVISNTIDNHIGATTKASAYFSFPLPPCTTRPTLQFVETFRGPASGCSPAGGTCAVGEPILFSMSLGDASADPCNFWIVNWGDGTSPETFSISEPTATIAPSHFFSTTGTFNAVFQLSTNGPRATAAGLSVSVAVFVTTHGSPPQPKRRSAHH